MALLAAGTAVLGAAGGVGAALADPSAQAIEAACTDPTRTTPTVTVEGQPVDCDALTETTATGTDTGTGTTTDEDTPTGTTTSATETGSEPTSPPPTTTPVDEPEPEPTAAPEPPAAPEPSPAPPATTPAPPAAAPQAPQEPAPAAAPAAAKPDDDGEDAAKGEPTAQQQDKAAAAKERRRRARARARARRAAAAARTAQRRVKSRTDNRARAEERAARDRNSAAIYAALPAQWTSLSPITLPAYGVDDFPIPPFLLPIYQAAAAEYGIPWEVLASINEIETDFGRNTSVSSAGALGWMQFIPSSWNIWGTDGDGDGRRDPRHPVDAIFAAANYLNEAGAQTDLPKAIYAYNHAAWYVNRVVERAREFASLDKMMVAALSERALREDNVMYIAKSAPFLDGRSGDASPGQALLLSKRALTRIILESDSIKVYEGGRRDIQAGHIDRRILATLVFLDRSGMSPTVSSLFSGHSRFTTSGNVSAHSYGHAVDIAAVNGTPIAGHQGAGSITEDALRKLIELQGYLRPNQIITLMTVDGQDNTLAMGDHDDHIHLGFPRVPKVRDGDRPQDVRRHAEELRRLEHRVAKRARSRKAQSARARSRSHAGAAFSSFSLRVPSLVAR